MDSDVIVSTSSSLTADPDTFGVRCHHREGADPFVVLRVGTLLTVHFGDPAVLARFAAAVAEAQKAFAEAAQRHAEEFALTHEIGA